MKDCFAYNSKGSKPICTALTKLECKGCRFYKTKKQALDENEACRKRCKKLGYKYKSVFKDEELNGQKP